MILILLLILSGGVLEAHQNKMGVEPDLEEDPFLFELANYKSLNIQLDSNQLDLALSTFIEKKFPGIEVQFDYFKGSPGGYHIQFIQTSEGLPVFNRYLKLNMDKQFNLISMTWMLADIQTLEKQSNAVSDQINWEQFGFVEPIIREKRDVWLSLPNSDVYRPAISYKVEDLSDHKFELLCFDSEGLQVRRDLNCYLPDSQINAYVFNPDPLTTAMVSYGGSYADNGDADAAALNAERQSLIVETTYNNGVFTPGNQYVIISEHSAPSVQPITTSQGFFNNTRSESGFEDLNVLYHITIYQKYMRSLGFFNLVDYAIPVDAHALSGQDNSMFSSSTNPPRLFFGEGGVDDAEDADVVVHEYGHAISFSAAPGSNVGFERTAIDEGFGDYLATSYSRSIVGFNWFKMFSWDGHNEFWNGRNAASSKVYDADMNSSIHSNGEIWNSALMEIFDQMGRDSTDRLVLQSMYSYSANIGFQTVASFLLQADTLLYGGKNFCNIYPILLARGLIKDTINPDPCTFFDPGIFVDAGKDTTVCPGAPVILGGTPTADPGNQVQWSPDMDLTNVTAPNPIASPMDSVVYTVKVTDDQGYFNTDIIRINTKVCSDSPILTNTEGFASGKGTLRLVLPIGTTNARLSIADANGRLIWRGNLNGSDQYLLTQADNLPGGVYLFEVKLDGGKRNVLKAVRLFD